MDQLDQIVRTISLTMGAAWASGINLYATILVLGLLGATQGIVLPAHLQILTHPFVLVAAGLMYVVEFCADKMPGVDTGWDALHTFIRIPAGALLAAGAVGHVDPAIALAAAIVGAGMASASHAAKAGSRVIINASPEPFTNWVASVGEDIAVIVGVWAALQHPWIFAVFLGLFVIFLIWLLPKLWRAIASVIGRIRQFLGGKKPAPDPANPPESSLPEG